MKIEKISDNKLKVVLSKQDLIDKDIDIRNLKPNSMESQDLFFDILQEIEFYYGFDMGGSQILVEGVSTSNGGMILTVTKTNSVHEGIPPIHRPHSTKKPSAKLKAKKKTTNQVPKDLIYKFDSFDNFIEFAYRLRKLPIKYENSLYEYNQEYYLSLSCTLEDTPTYKQLLFAISDYAVFTPNISMKNRLSEYGTLLIKKNAIQKILKK